MQQLKEMTGMSEEEILEASEAGREICSLHSPIGGEQDNQQAMTLADHIEDPKESETNWWNRYLVQEMLDGLEEKERRLLQLRYFAAKTQTQTAKELQISQVAVCRLEKKTLEKLRRQWE